MVCIYFPSCSQLQYIMPVLQYSAGGRYCSGFRISMGTGSCSEWIIILRELDKGHCTVQMYPDALVFWVCFGFFCSRPSLESQYKLDYHGNLNKSCQNTTNVYLEQIQASVTCIHLLFGLLWELCVLRTILHCKSQYRNLAYTDYQEMGNSVLGKGRCPAAVIHQQIHWVHVGRAASQLSAHKK